jgi:hypothetical protein
VLALGEIDLGADFHQRSIVMYMGNVPNGVAKRNSRQPGTVVDQLAHRRGDPASGSAAIGGNNEVRKRRVVGSRVG